VESAPMLTDEGGHL